MYFYGHQKSSFIDYPNKIATVLFTGGCNFRCPYCHNSQIVNKSGNRIAEEEIFGFLEKRKKYIDAVCICGGEPTIHQGIYDFIRTIKNRGFLVKLDTNGINPELLSKLTKEKLVDYIAMDIKAPSYKYEYITKSQVDIEKIKTSVDIIINSNIDYEFRTTICKELLTKEDILEISNEITGAKKYVIQNFKDSDNVLDGKGKYSNFSKEELNDIKIELEYKFDNIIIKD